MSDIEKIQKINQMSAYLKDHGFANSSEDALKEAEKMYNGKIAKDEKPAESEKKEEVHANFDRNLEVFKNNTAKELTAIKDDIKNLTDKMNEIVKFINTIEEKQKRPIEVPEDQENMPKPPSKQQKQATLKTEEKPKNERVGALKPGDVSIEDTFYYGNK